MRNLLMALPLIALVACATAAPVTEIPVRGDGACVGSRLSQFVGQPASSQLGAEMLAASGAKTIRWVPHGGVVTMEFNGNRVTVQLDPANRVASANCG